jgi:hypothetical protein
MLGLGKDALEAPVDKGRPCVSKKIVLMLVISTACLVVIGKPFYKSGLAALRHGAGDVVHSTHPARIS